MFRPVSSSGIRRPLSKFVDLMTRDENSKEVEKSMSFKILYKFISLEIK